MKLETKRLILRKLYKKDWKDLVESRNNINIVKWLLYRPYPFTKKHAIDFIENSIKSWNRKPILSYIFAIEHKKQKKVIGVVILYLRNNDLGKGTTVSWINPKYQRKGYITEAKISLHNFAFNELKLRRIDSSTFIENIISKNALKKLGFKKEGIKRKSAVSKVDGKVHDEVIYGLLKEDWDKIKNNF